MFWFQEFHFPYVGYTNGGVLKDIFFGISESERLYITALLIYIYLILTHPNENRNLVVCRAGSGTPVSRC